MPQLGFEPTIPMFERAKRVYALDMAATVIGIYMIYIYLYTDKVEGKPVVRPNTTSMKTSAYGGTALHSNELLTLLILSELYNSATDQYT
jgi:hypothetical protein